MTQCNGGMGWRWCRNVQVQSESNVKSYEKALPGIIL